MTTPTHHEDELTARLHALADTVDRPAQTESVLRRGRATVRRTRVLKGAATLSVVATAGVLGATSGVLGHSGDSQRLGGPAGGSSTSVTPSARTHHSKSPSKHLHENHPKVVETWCNHIGPQRAREEDRRFGSARDGYADLVIEHLDPHQLHLHKSEGGETRTGPNCVLYALGTGLGYTSPGEDGLGLVSVEVTTATASAREHLAPGDAQTGLAPGWHPAASLPSGAVQAYVKQNPGGIAVAVIRADDTEVELFAERLWGNNSQTPVSHMDITAEQLLTTAADPRFQLP